MAAPGKYHTDNDLATSATITFTVTEGSLEFGLRVDDVLEWDPAQPRGRRVTLRRPLAAHEGLLDAWQLRGKIVADGLGILAARQRMVARLLLDGDSQAAA
jgi:hypothetical protein